MPSPIFEPADLPQLAAPTPLESMLFESGAISALILFAAAIAIGLVVNKAAKPKPAIIIILAGLIGAIGVFAASKVVTTDREHIDTRLRSLIVSVADADESTLQSVLHDAVQVRTRFGSGAGRDRVIAMATSQAAPAVSSVRVLETRVGQTGPRVARSLVKIKAVSDSPLALSWWLIDWSRPSEDTNDWVATHIEPVWIQGIKDPAGRP